MNTDSLVRQLNIIKTGFCKSIDIMIDGLKKKEKEDKPLTLEELKRFVEDDTYCLENRIGKHIWVRPMNYSFRIAAILDAGLIDKEYKTYAITGCEEEYGFEFTEDNYGKDWLAYEA